MEALIALLFLCWYAARAVGYWLEFMSWLGARAGALWVEHHQPTTWNEVMLSL